MSEATDRSHVAYKEAFVAAIRQEYPLCTASRQRLKQVQERLELEDSCISLIEAEVISHFEQNIQAYRETLTLAMRQAYPLSVDAQQRLQQAKERLGLSTQLTQKIQAELNSAFYASQTVAQDSVAPSQSSSSISSSSLAYVGEIRSPSAPPTQRFSPIQQLLKIIQSAWKRPNSTQASQDFKKPYALPILGSSIVILGIATAAGALYLQAYSSQTTVKTAGLLHTYLKMETGEALRLTAKQLGSTNTPESLNAAIAFADLALKNSTNDAESQNLVNQWVDQLAQFATNGYQKGDLEQAIQIAQAIPDNLHPQIHRDATQWVKEQETLQQLKAAQEASDWASILEKADSLRDVPYWDAEVAPIVAQAHQRLNPTPTNPSRSTPARVVPSPARVTSPGRATSTRTTRQPTNRSRPRTSSPASGDRRPPPPR